MKKNNKLAKQIVLFINTSKEKQLDVFLLQKGGIFKKHKLKGNFKVSDKLLKIIDKLLQKNKIDFKQLKGIIVVSGPGPFTSIRIAAAVANTLSFVLKVPVIGVSNKENFTDLKLIQKGLKEIRQKKIGNYIQPFYNQEPNITIAKK